MTTTSLAIVAYLGCASSAMVSSKTIEASGSSIAPCPQLSPVSTKLCKKWLLQNEIEFNVQQQLRSKAFGGIADDTSTQLAVGFNDIRNAFARVKSSDLSDILSSGYRRWFLGGTGRISDFITKKQKPTYIFSSLHEFRRL